MSATAGAVTAPRQDLGSVLPAGEAVGRIIVGHTTDHTARIWVQGSSRYPIVRLALQLAGLPPTAPPVDQQEKTVLESQDYTASFDFDRLDPSSAYEVVARFTDRAEGARAEPRGQSVTALFRTFPRIDDPAAGSFSFLLGSCNLSVVAINNLAAQALQLAGFYLAERSLERPIPERRPRPDPDESRLTRFGRWLMRWRWARRLLGRLIKVSLALVFLGPGGKWSKQPLLRSPFLKLAGMFAGYRVEFRHGRRAPHAGDMLVGRNSGETGTLAFEPVLESGSWGKDATGFMIVTDTRGRFQLGEWLRTIRDDDEQNTASPGENIAQVGPAGGFAGCRIEFRRGRRAPHAGETLVGRDSGETGVLAFEPVLESGSWGKDATGFMILTDTRGRFQPGEWLRAIRDDDEQNTAPPGEDIAQVGPAQMLTGYRIEFSHGRCAPHAGETLVGRDSRETGTLAFDPVLASGSWGATGFMILTDTGGRFQPGEWLRTIRDDDEKNTASPGENIAQVGPAARFLPEDLAEPAFTIHAGDQIYYDFPKAAREPQLDSYRDSYRESWFEDRFQRFFLTRGPHYMTMDDHEIVDGFARDLELPQTSASAAGSAPRPEPKRFKAETYLAAAIPAYQEYVHSRHPGEPLYYHFCHGTARFFVMDTRTCRRRDSASRMIDDDQMGAFQAWLTSYPEDLKFVVSSVPFVAEVMRPDGAVAVGSRENDKWCGRPFRWQRDDIIDFIEDKGIDRVVFLVGDMHCAYYASMSIGDRHRWTRRVVHELAGGPINQLEFSRQDQFANVAELITRRGRIPYQVRLHQFHGNASAVMHIEVNSVADPREPGTQVPEIVWRVIRTMTDPESVPDPARKASVPKGQPPGQWDPKRIKDHPPIAGRITLGRRWTIDELPPW